MLEVSLNAVPRHPTAVKILPCNVVIQHWSPPAYYCQSFRTFIHIKMERQPNDSKSAGRVPPDGKEEKVSKADLKKQKQAEKIARRAQAKQSKEPALTPEAHPPKKAGAPKHDSTSTFEVQSSKGNHKRVGSVQKGLSLRPEKAVEAPTTDSKRVALLGHLYGQQRRTSLAGANKDVHPAVLALGLQMSSYVVCGSSARCVATLLAFKRVHNSLSQIQITMLKLMNR